MKFFIIATIIYFAYPLVFAMEDHCAADCSLNCQEQAYMAEEAFFSHQATCRGEEPTLTDPICAQSCSTGCKSVMGGQEQLLTEHYDACGGGSGNMGRLYCDGKKIVNSHSQEVIGEAFSTSSQCKESVDTLNYNVLCAKSSSGYTVFNKMGLQMGVGSSFLDQCVETLMSIKNDRICVKISANRFGAYDLRTMKRVGPDYNFLSSCKGGR